jgi:DNA polymerase-3 subunit epsilon
MVKDSPNWIDVNFALVGIIGKRDVIIYNAEYDVKVINASCERWDILKKERFEFGERVHCAMQAYAEFNGLWSDYRQQYQWVKLIHAYQRLVRNPERIYQAHHAMHDVMMTYDVCLELQRIDHARRNK